MQKSEGFPDLGLLMWFWRKNDQIKDQQDNPEVDADPCLKYKLNLGPQ